MKQELNPQFLKLINKQKQSKAFSQKKQDRQRQNLGSEKYKQQKFQGFNFGFGQDDWKDKSVKQSHKSSQNIRLNKQSEKDFSFFQQFGLQGGKTDKQGLKRNKLQLVYNRRKEKQKNTKFSQLQQISKFNEINSYKINDKHVSNSKVIQNCHMQIQQESMDLFQQYDQQFNQSQQPEQQMPRVKNAYSTNTQSSNNSAEETAIMFIQSKSSEDQTYYFQTENLLKRQTQNNFSFSRKNMPITFNFIKLVYHIISISTISILYGFYESLVLLIVHDFAQFGFLVFSGGFNWKQFSQKRKKNVKIQITEESNALNADSINDQMSKCDRNKDHSNKEQISFLDNQKKIKFYLQFHKYYQHSLYISPVSLIGFIIFQCLHVNTIFFPSIFAIQNWISIIVLSILLIIEFIINFKVNMKLKQIIFHYKNALQDAQTYQQHLRNKRNISFDAQDQQA